MQIGGNAVPLLPLLPQQARAQELLNAPMQFEGLRGLYQTHPSVERPEGFHFVVPDCHEDVASAD